MIISHRRKFAFFANLKTGSKAIGALLRSCGDFNQSDICARQPYASTRTVEIYHPGHNVELIDARSDMSLIHFTPTEAIENALITLEQLREYKCFALFRDPEARHYAIQLAALRHDPHDPGDNFRHLQFRWFEVDGEQVVTALNFTDWDASVKTIMKAAGIENCPVPLMREKSLANTPGCREYKRSDYGPDLQFQHKQNWTI